MEVFLSKGLLTSLRLCDQKDHVIVSTIYSIYKQLLDLGNVKQLTNARNRRSNKYINFNEIDLNKIKVVRGFFPGTPIMFKACLFNQSEHKYMLSVKQIIPHTITHSTQSNLYISDLEQLVEKANNILVREEILLDEDSADAVTQEEDLMPKLRLPRCMSPLGIKLFKFKKQRGSNGKKRKI